MHPKNFIIYDLQDSELMNQAIKPPVRNPKTLISAENLYIKKDVLSQLKYAYAVNPTSFQRRFAKVGVVVNSEEDLIPLAQIHESGLDVSGMLGPNETIHAFDIMEIARSVKLNKNALAQAGIKHPDMIVHRGEVKIL